MQGKDHLVVWYWILKSLGNIQRGKVSRILDGIIENKISVTKRLKPANYLAQPSQGVRVVKSRRALRKVVVVSQHKDLMRIFCHVLALSTLDGRV